MQRANPAPVRSNVQSIAFRFHAPFVRWSDPVLLISALHICFTSLIVYKKPDARPDVSFWSVSDTVTNTVRSISYKGRCSDIKSIVYSILTRGVINGIVGLPRSSMKQHFVALIKVYGKEG